MAYFRNNRKMSQKIYLLVVVYCILVIYAILENEKYPFDDYELFERDLDIDIETKREWKVVKRRLDYTKDDNATHCDIYNITRNYTGKFDCVKTKTRPSTTVCLYGEASDMYISHDLKDTGKWEPHVLDDFQGILRRNPDIGLLDLGANIGYYSLIAAKMGHKVVAVEPYYPSIYRLHRASQIEGVADRITVIHNAISDRRVLGTIRTSGDNQGDTRIDMDYRPCTGSCPQPVNTIVMDDLLEVITFNSTLIKLDIQGYECQAMTHADKLLRRLDVPYILMEWGLMGQYFGDNNYKSGDKYRVQELIRKLFDLEYRPYSLSNEGSKPLDPSMWHKWPFDIVWQKLLDKQEYENVLRAHYFNWP